MAAVTAAPTGAPSPPSRAPDDQRAKTAESRAGQDSAHDGGCENRDSHPSETEMTFRPQQQRHQDRRLGHLGEKVRGRGTGEAESGDEEGIEAKVDRKHD